MAHVMERTLFNTLLFNNSKIGVYSGNPLIMMEDLKILKPTIFISVPRIFNKVYDKIQEKLNQKNSVVKSLVNMALESKMESLKQKHSYSHWLYDKLFFKNMREALGGSTRFVFTGSAPISPNILNDLKVMFSCPIVEGYG